MDSFNPRADRSFRIPPWIPAIAALLLAGGIHPGPPAATGAESASSSAQLHELLDLIQKPPAGPSLTLPPGTYRICDRPGKGITFRGWEDKEIVADGVTLILKPDQSVTLDQCRQVRLRGLTLDCDPLPWSEATLLAIDPAGPSATIQLEERSPRLEDLPQRDSLLYFVFDPQTLVPRPLLWEGFREFQAEKDGRYRLTGSTAGHFFAELDTPLGPKVGDKIALFNRGGPILQVRDSQDCVFENVSVHAAPGYAFYENGGEGGHRYLRCRIGRPAESRRLLATAADGFHSYLVRRGPVLEGCEFGDTADDTVAIHGFFSLVTGGGDQAVQLVAPFGIDFAPGDTLRFLRIPHGREIASSRVTSVRPAEQSDTDLEAKLRDWTREGFRMRKLPQKKIWSVELDPPVSLPADSLVLASATARCGNGAVVRNCVIRRSHKRGILIKADDVTVEGNTLEDVAGPSILIEPELFWLEGPLPRKVAITGNTIVRSSWRSMNRQGASLGLGGAIEVRTRLARRQSPPQQDPYPLMENFTITDNVLRENGAYAIVLGNVAGARITGNTVGAFFARPGADESRGLARAFDSTEHEAGSAPSVAASPGGVLVFGSREVEISGNRFEPRSGPAMAKVVVGPWCHAIRGTDLPESSPAKAAK